MRSKEEQEQIVKRALSMPCEADSKPPDNPPGAETSLILEPRETPAGEISTALLIEHSDAEVNAIIDVWRRLFAFSESHVRIAAHLRALRRWQSQRGS